MFHSTLGSRSCAETATDSTIHWQLVAYNGCSFTCSDP